MLQADRISWCQSDGPIIAGVDLRIGAGCWISLVGPNGSGKSTLLQVLSGIREFPAKHFSGQIRWESRDWIQLPAKERAQCVAYLGSELTSAFPVTVEEAIAAGGFARGNSSGLQEALSFCELEPLRSRQLADLSGGERQRVLLARGLCQGARLLFLDETFSKMDLDYQFDLGKKLQMLTQKGLSIVLVSHDPAMAVRFADRVILLEKGKLLADGVPAKVLTTERIKKLYPRSDLTQLFQSRGES